MYSYLRPIVAGRSVLEIGCGQGEGARHLATLGARHVVGADRDASAISAARARGGRSEVTYLTGLSLAALQASGPFDVVLIPEAAALFVSGSSAEPSLASVRSLVRTGGFLVCAAANADRASGGAAVSYYDIVDALAPHFPRVRMFGQTPFAAFGIAEFDAASEGLRVESGLVDEAAEQPTDYLAVAGPEDPVSLGYALVQVPLVALGGAAVAPATLARATVGEDSDLLADLRRRLAEAQGQADGALRVSRAHAEEIEELRARLRRAAEARAELDEEVGRLRRALTEADESVLNLTRRTTEEMTSLAQRLTAGLRSAPMAPREDAAPALVAELRRREEELAARESALFERDERIALLESDKQDLTWRLDAAEQRIRESMARMSALESTGAATRERDELLARLRAHERGLEEFRRAAAAHMDEVTRLRDAWSEQSALVVELEEAMQAAEARLVTAEKETTRLRAVVVETEEADRARRSRLAELEGTLLRLRRQASEDSERRAQAERLAQGERIGDPEALARLTERVAELTRESDGLRARLVESESARGDAVARASDAAARLVALEHELGDRHEIFVEREALQARVAELESRPETSKLEATLAEVEGLRGALERSEEQLWDARSRLVEDRQSIEILEQAVADAEAKSEAFASAHAGPGEGTYQALLAQVLDEVAEIEAAVRGEIGQLAAVEGLIVEWRMALAANGASAEAPPGATET